MNTYTPPVQGNLVKYSVNDSPINESGTADFIFQRDNDTIEFYGVNTQLNGDFDSSVGWGLDSPLVVVDGKLVCDGSQGSLPVRAWQTGAINEGQSYIVDIFVTSLQQGSLDVQLGVNNHYIIDKVGHHRFIETCSGDNRIHIWFKDGFIGSVDPVSTKELNGDFKGITYTYQNGLTDSSFDFSHISGITADGEYKIIKEAGMLPIATTATITEGYIFPDSPIVDDLHTDISKAPYELKGYKYDGTDWQETNFVKLGYFSRTAGVISTPQSYALNGVAIIPEYTGSQTITHNIGVLNTVYTEGYSDGWRVANFYHDAGDHRIDIAYITDNSFYCNFRDTFSKARHVVKRAF